MSTQFSRLYRELCQSNPHDPVYDIHFTKERKGVLASLGHSVNIHKDIPVQLNKHHGKAARRRKAASRLKAISVENSSKLKREREDRQTSMKTAQVHALTTKIQGLMQEDKFVSKNLWSQYDRIYGEQNSSTVDSHSRKKIPMRELKTDSDRRGIQKRTKSSIRIDYSKNKWSKVEREKLNRIYWELKRPASKSLALWENYFLEFAHIFHVYFSDRSIDSIVQKVKYLYATRQFAEPGEMNYWKSVSNSHLSNSSSRNEGKPFDTTTES